MWLFLDSSLESIDPASANMRAALEQLCYAVGRGEHALGALPATVRHLLTGEYSPAPKAVLRKLLDSAPDILARYERAKFSVRIVAEGLDPLRLTDFEWTIPIDWLRLNGVPASILLAENTRDADMFKIAAAQSMVVDRTGTNFQVAIANGGGADTPRVLKGEVDSKRSFVLCITDSDRQCPAAQGNRTSVECSKIASGSDWVSSHLMLEERELENVVPVNLVEDALAALGDDAQLKKLMDLRLVCEIDPRAWSYFDLKEGTPLRVMFGNCSQFWLAFRDHPVCRARVNEACIEAGRCSDERCGCQIAPSLGTRIVDHVMQYLSLHSIHATAKRAQTSANRQRWFEVGALVAAWGASSPKMRS